jgi:hypothetical protein
VTGPADQIDWMSDWINQNCGHMATVTAISDAGILRMAARILRKDKQTFAIRVIIRVLELRAERLEKNQEATS